jgi:hypothetical protein
MTLSGCAMFLARALTIGREEGRYKGDVCAYPAGM